MSQQSQQSKSIELNFSIQNSQNGVIQPKTISKSRINTSTQIEHGGLQIFLTHQQKIQATYNFQSLFRKKSHLYNFKNKKKQFTKSKPDPKQQSGTGTKPVKKGHWLAQQSRKYHWFLQLYSKHFILKHLRRTDKIFKTMSCFIGTRQAEQCRSHHQKMQKKYKTFYQIISMLRREFYGTCSVEGVRQDLEEQGMMKQGEALVEEEVLRQMQRGKQFHKQQSSPSPSEGQQQSQQIEQEKPNILLLGERYEQEFHYKLG